MAKKAHVFYEAVVSLQMCHLVLLGKTNVWQTNACLVQTMGHREDLDLQVLSSYPHPPFSSSRSLLPKPTTSSPSSLQLF